MEHLEKQTAAEAAKETESSKPYTMRPLRDEDLFPILSIVGKVFPDDLASVFAQVVTKEKTVQEVGYDVGFRLVVAVIKNLHKVGDEVYALLSELSGIPAADIRKMKFGTTPKMIWEIYNDVKNQDFFGAASKSS